MNCTLNFKNNSGLQLETRGRASSTKSQSFALRLFIVATVFLGVMGQSSTLVDSAAVGTSREIASLRFPQVQTERDEEDMVASYMPYLQFVTAIGSEVDAASTKLLVQAYQNLRKRSRSGAALFLKGLRYEMIQRVELSGWNPSSLSTNSPEMRRFVARYLKIWVREADEQMFRSYSNQIASRNRVD